jgi:hypothetical protein
MSINKYDKNYRLNPNMDKTYRSNPNIDIKKGNELFNIIQSLNTYDLIQYSLINQVSLNYTNNEGNNLIHETINIKQANEHSKLAMIKFLIQNNVNPDKMNKYNQTPLHFACKYQYPLIVSYLLDTGVNPNFTDDNGLTPFHNLLIGEIKIIDDSNEIESLISTDKKGSIDKSSILLKVKTELWERIKDTDLLETIKKTIDILFTDDKKIIDYEIQIRNIIAKIIKEIDSNNTDSIRESIKNIQDNINKIISNNLKLDDISDITIHSKEENSWKPKNYSSDLYLIKHGEIKKKLKEDIKNEINKIINMESNNIDLIDYDEMHDSILSKPIIPGYIYNNPLESKIKHIHALDNASNIIDIDKNIFIGGPRMANINSILNEVIFDELIKLDTNHMVLYLLADIDFKDIKNINKLDDSNDIDILITILNPAKYNKANNYNVDELHEFYDTLTFIIMAYNAIINKNISINIKGLIENTNFNTNITRNPNGMKYKNRFENKWEALFNGRNIIAWLLSMYEDLECKKSLSNLKYDIDDKLIILLGALNGNDIGQMIVHSYKPHYHKYTHLDSSNLSEWLAILFDESKQYKKDTVKVKKELQDILDKYKLTNIDTLHDDKNILCSLLIEYYNNMENKPLKNTFIDTIYLIQHFNIPPSNFNFSILLIPPVNYNYLDCQPSMHNIFYVNDNDNEGYNKFRLAHSISIDYYGLLDDIYVYNIFHDILKKNDKYTISFTYDVDKEIANASQLPGRPINVFNIREYPSLLLNYVNINNIYDTNNSLSTTTTHLSYNLKYYLYNLHADNVKYRLPITINFINRINKNLYFLNQQYLFIKNKMNIILNELNNNNSTNLSNIYQEYYIALQIIVKMYESNRNMLTKELQDDNNKKAKELKINMILDLKFNPLDIKSITNGLNKINSSYYLYFYLFKNPNLVKLSRFNYYQLPNPDMPAEYHYFSKKSDNKYWDEPNENIGDKETVVKQERGFNTLISYPFKKLDDDYFRRLKKSALPPSLQENLSDFYKYALIELIKKELDTIDLKLTDAELTKNILKLVNYNDIKDYTINGYYLIAQLIQELVKEQCIFYINTSTANVLKTKVLGLLPINIESSGLFPVNNFNIRLGLNDLSFINNIKDNKDDIMMNIYNMIEKPIIKDTYISYSSDMSNLSRTVKPYQININTNIIDSILSTGANPYVLNNEGKTCIYPVLKNYNYKIIECLKKNGINFNHFENLSPLEFIKNEENNLLYNILGNYSSLESILNNITSHASNSVSTIVRINSKFGNNINKDISLSFNIVAYLLLQMLSENIEDCVYHDVNINNLELILGSKNIGRKSVYLYENWARYNIPNNYQNIILKDNIEIKMEEKKQYQEIKDKYDNIINSTGAKKPSDYLTISDKIDNINKSINSMNTYIIANNSILENVSHNNENMIERYKMEPNIFNKWANSIIILFAWSQLMKSPLDQDNMNLLILQLLLKQKDSTLSQDTYLQTFKYIASLCESYFNKPKFTNSNIMLKNINDILLYITNLVIGNSIEVITRKVLFNYLRSVFNTDSMDNIQKKLNIILDSLLFNLYNEVCPNLVLNTVFIFENIENKNTHSKTIVKEILKKFFLLLDNSPIKLNDDIRNIFNFNVIPYLDSFIGRSIELWQVIMENIMKMIICNYRILKTKHVLQM